jgi:DNA-binding XRE family transcriptional regulator
LQRHPRNRIKELAARHGETIGAVADAIGISRSTLYSVVRGAAEPWPKLRQDLADHFDTTVSQVFPASRSTDRRVS